MTPSMREDDKEVEEVEDDEEVEVSLPTGIEL